MRSDAYIRVTCDAEGCGCSEEITLCPTARHGWDERYIDGELEHMGWLVVGNSEYCKECRKEHES
jgi:hypothetical protein